jgi:hypothetical protein
MFHNQRKTKMTDLEKFIALYKELGVDLSGKKEQDGRIVIIIKVGEFLTDGDSVLDKVCGYLDVYSDIVFDRNGKFISQGLWKEL